MKVRWTEESVRFRITPTELDTLLSGDAVQQTLAVSGGEWCAELSADDGDVPCLAWRGPVLSVTLTCGELVALADAKAEGVYLRLGEPRCRVLVEKDFPCAHPHADEACEPETERFVPTPGYLQRKDLGHGPAVVAEHSAEAILS